MMMAGIMMRLIKVGSFTSVTNTNGQTTVVSMAASHCYGKSVMKALDNASVKRTFSSIVSSRLNSYRLPAPQCLGKFNLNSAAVGKSLKCVNHQRSHKMLYSSRARFDIHKNLPRDVLVYSHNNDKFYQILSYFGIFQMMMWGYVALFSFQELKSLPVEIKDTSGLPWWKKFLYKEGQYKNALSAIGLILGTSVLFITLTYPRRAVKSLWLLKGGNNVEITTYSWLGKTNTFKKPVEHLSCTEGRVGKGNHVPLKVKDTKFFFLLDKQGTFHNVDLFDLVVGLERKI